MSSLLSLVESVRDNPAGFGPGPEHVPANFAALPYAPFSKSDRLGRIVDWCPQSAPPTNGGVSAPPTTGGAKKHTREAYGAAAAGAFAHRADDAAFARVDVRNSGALKSGGAQKSGNAQKSGGVQKSGGNLRPPVRGSRPAARGGYVPRGRFRDPPRVRDASVDVRPTWEAVEEIEFSRLAKLRLDVSVKTQVADDSQDVSKDVPPAPAYGLLYEYDKAFDRMNLRQERALTAIDRIRYNLSASEDPVLRSLADADAGSAASHIYTTTAVLSLLMLAPRSVYPWDLIFTRRGNALFIDKRDGSALDFLSVNENAGEPPFENEKDTLNTPASLALEATYVNQNFAFQAVKESRKTKLDLDHPNPFYSPEETEPLASCGYRYRTFDLSVGSPEDPDYSPVLLTVRTEVDAYVKNSSGEKALITLNTLNEFDSKAPGSGGAPDWRLRLDSQRGAVVATEMKNNSAKLSRWAVQSILADAEQMKIAFVSRNNPRDNSRHTILGTQSYKPYEFAAQMNINLANGWGIVRTIADLCFAQPEGKFVLMKDPNKPTVRLYSVPEDEFEE